MKKIIIIPLVVFVCFLTITTKAQAALVDCSSAKIDLSALLQGTKNPEEVPPLVCLGEQMNIDNSSAKAKLETGTYGNVSYYVEKSSETQLVGMITYGKIEEITADEQKKYAQKYFSCPIDLSALKAKNSDINFASAPGSLALLVYKELTELIKNPTANSCVGTYFSVDSNNSDTSTTNETMTIGNLNIATPTLQIVKDKRPMFAQVISSFLTSSIESGIDVKVNSVSQCDDETKTGEGNCYRYFFGGEKNEFGEQEKKFAIRLIRQKMMDGESFDVAGSGILSQNRYNLMISTEYAVAYSEVKDGPSLDFGTAQYKLLKKDNFRKLIILKDTWIIEINYTNDINDSFAIGVAKELIDNIEGNLDTEKSTDTKTDTKTASSTAEAVIEKKVTTLLDRLLGKIVIKVQGAGEAYYIDPNTRKMYYLGKPEDSLKVIRERGVGITNANLEKISIGIASMTGPDTDGDGLSDMFEDAMKTDKNKVDTDGDSYSDKSELEGTFDPRSGNGKKMAYSNAFSKQQAGKIFLAVENSGEAWYINPSDNRRYFLGRPGDAYNIMKKFGLGVSNADFATLESQVK